MVILAAWEKELPANGCSRQQGQKQKQPYSVKGCDVLLAMPSSRANCKQKSSAFMEYHNPMEAFFMGEKLSSRQVRALLGITDNALSQRVLRGKFPAPCERRPYGKKVRLFWDAEEVEKFLTEKFPFYSSKAISAILEKA